MVREDDLTKLYALCLARLAALGVSTQVLSRIDAHEARMTELGKANHYPMISTNWNDFSEREAFGLMLRQNGRDIGGVAGRFIDLGRQTHDDHWRQSYRRMYGGGEVVPVRRACPASTKVSGRIVYLGELYLAEESRGIGGVSALTLYLMHTLVALRWSPDWIYGFMRAQDVLRGKAAQYGFTRAYPGAQKWREEGDRRSSAEYLVLMREEELVASAGHFAVEPGQFVPLPNPGPCNS